ncbi:FtsX-like permease family protein [Ilyomonas limi]|uniref:FtsX-like permease family protein n=1 Tax=Ilyomonas limi TaxID=2575867 RepID=A0A4U3L1A9_9BACT|nr:FtsX-like permease family protein [Ilyomonas limi]TKK68552.1 FtsX-like permease family protein [Ilyomonas limi]
MLNNLLKKLIKSGSGRIRFVMAIAGLSIALALILSAVQLQANYDELLHSKTNQDSIANFLVINKQVTAANTGSTTLSNKEIDDLKQQPFVEAVGVLTPSRFKVSASGGQHIPFYTELFFESVPNDFLDVQSKDWKWDDNSQFIPMIVPNTFLDMYNFGFATSQDLPQLSQQLVMSLPIQVNITGPQGVVQYYARVVGFSDRITSVLVPQQFMDWANAKFGTTQQAQPSRVVIRTNDPGNPRLVSYLKEHSLSTDADKTRFSKYRQVVNMVVNVSGVIGAVMFLFALLIFTLFIQLTIASSKEDIALLVTLGAAPKQLYQFLMKQFFPVNILIVVIVLLIIAVLQFFAKQYLSGQHIFISAYPSLFTFIAAFIILIVLWLVNRITIKKYISANA